MGNNSTRQLKINDRLKFLMVKASLQFNKKKTRNEDKFQMESNLIMLVLDIESSNILSIGSRFHPTQIFTGR